MSNANAKTKAPAKAVAKANKVKKVKAVSAAPVAPAKSKPIVDPLTKQQKEKAAKLIKGLGTGEGELEPGIITCILHLFTNGFKQKEIISLGYNKSTVYRQTRELTKLKKAPALEYQGHALYEARIRQLMQAKKLTREKAIKALAAGTSEKTS